MTLTVDRIALAPDLSISRVLTGLWQIADMERDGRALDPEPTARALRAYVDAGFTSFDMADHYGSAEIVASHLREGAGRGESGATVHEVGAETGTADAARRACGGRAIAAAAPHAADRPAAVPCVELRRSELARRPAASADTEGRGLDRAHRPDERGRGASEHGARHRDRGDFGSGLLLAARSARGRRAVGRVPCARREAARVRNAGRWLVVESLARPARARLGTERHLVADEVRPLHARRRRVGRPAASAARRGCGGASTRRVDRQRRVSLHPRATGRGRPHHRRPAR